MEDIILRPHCSCNPASALSNKLAVAKDSRARFKPKVRIIHIFAPEIIKTDVANFRELVQRLTGKPCESKSNKKKPRSSPSKKPKAAFDHDQSNMEAVKPQDGILNEMRGGTNIKASSFLDGFADLNGFIHDLAADDNFVLAP